MDKQTLQYIRQAFIKCILSIFLILVMGVDYYIVRDVNQYILYTYLGVMFVCLCSLFLTLFSKIKKISYLICVISFIIYLVMGKIPAIKEAHDADACLDSGHGVWDYDEHRCRSDCYHWSKERGCLKDNVEV